MRSLVRREHSGSTLEFVSQGLCSSNSSCRKPKANRWNKSNANWWIKFLTDESNEHFGIERKSGCGNFAFTQQRLASRCCASARGGFGDSDLSAGVAGQKSDVSGEARLSGQQR